MEGLIFTPRAMFAHFPKLLPILRCAAAHIFFFSAENERF